MGWDFCRNIEGDASPEAFVVRTHKWEYRDAQTGEMVRQHVIDTARVGSVVYAALHIQRDEHPPIVTAIVVLTEGHPKRPGFGSKGMDEAMGPVESNCPARILDLLSPVESLRYPEYAIQWRARCRANLPAMEAA